MDRPKGMHPSAWEAFLAAGVDPARIGQTVGNAPASAGTHAADGTWDCGEEYCAATDISVKRPTQIGDADVKPMLERLARHGFAVFYRKPGQDHWPADQVEHCHIVFAGIPMKEALRNQVHAFCHAPMLNGLISDVPYQYWQPSPEAQQAVRDQFLASGNPVNG